MPRTVKIYSVIFVLLMLAFVVNDFTQVQPVDWNPNFLRNNKEPYGIFIFNNELKEVFAECEVEYIQTTPYEYFSKDSEDLNFIDNDSVLPVNDENDPEFFNIDNDTDTILNENESNQKNAIQGSSKSTYFFVNAYVDIDPSSADDLLDFVKDGNTVWISSFGFPEKLQDTLGIEVDHIVLPKINLKDSIQIGDFNMIEYEAHLSLANKSLDSKSYIYEKGMDNYFFKKLDSIPTTVLGYQSFEGIKKINFVKIKFGDGYFYLHTQPFVFTNYNLLKTKNSSYVSNLLSYIDPHKLLFDDRNSANSRMTSSPLRYILSQPALRWALYISLLGIVLFMLFRAKRTQRVVPIIEKLPNTSIGFAKTIGDLYYHEGKPQDIVNKKITFFLEHIRNTYLLDTQNLNEDFIKKLYAKSGVSLIEVERLIKYIINLSKQKEIRENSLVLLNNMINNFYQKTLK